MMFESVRAHTGVEGLSVGAVDQHAKSRLVLLVEPSLSQRYLMRALFEARGYRVVSAGTAAEADMKIRANGPCLALVSWELPDASAFSLIQSWRRDPITSRCSAFMMNARRDPSRAFRARSAGAVDLIQRPNTAKAIKDFFERSGELLAASERTSSVTGRDRTWRSAAPRMDRTVLMQRIRLELADAKSSGQPLSLGLVSLENLTDIKIEHGRAFALEQSTRSRGRYPA